MDPEVVVAARFQYDDIAATARRRAAPVELLLLRQSNYSSREPPHPLPTFT
jgi:hypothetical protein